MKILLRSWLLPLRYISFLLHVIGVFGGFAAVPDFLSYNVLKASFNNVKIEMYGLRVISVCDMV